MEFSFSCPWTCVGSSGRSDALNWRASTHGGRRRCTFSTFWPGCTRWPERLVGDIRTVDHDPGSASASTHEPVVRDRESLCLLDPMVFAH